MGRLGRVVGLVLACCIPAGTAIAQGRTLPTRTLDLSVHRADVRDVLRLFAEVGDVNIVYGEEVTGEVSFRFRNARWDDALRAVLHSKGLGMEWDGRILRVRDVRDARARARRAHRGPAHVRGDGAPPDAHPPLEPRARRGRGASESARA